MAEMVDDFDWDNVGASGFGGNYTSDQRAELEKLYGDTLTTVQEEEVIKGTVVGITDRDVQDNIAVGDAHHGAFNYLFLLHGGEGVAIKLFQLGALVGG
ncbi:MAG: hypothetical protein EOO58_01400, partial [Hymenobacter sp.]